MEVSEVAKGAKEAATERSDLDSQRWVSRRVHLISERCDLLLASEDFG
jgi:hypothetical protein